MRLALENRQLKHYTGWATSLKKCFDSVLQDSLVPLHVFASIDLFLSVSLYEWASPVLYAFCTTTNKYSWVEIKQACSSKYVVLFFPYHFVAVHICQFWWVLHYTKLFYSNYFKVPGCISFTESWFVIIFMQGSQFNSQFLSFGFGWASNTQFTVLVTSPGLNGSDSFSTQIDTWNKALNWTCG